MINKLNRHKVNRNTGGNTGQERWTSAESVAVKSTQRGTMLKTGSEI